MMFPRSFLVPLALLTGCAAAPTDKNQILGGGDTATGTDGGILIDGDPGTEFALGDTTPCEGLKCQQVACKDGATTSLSGSVYDPAARVPLYNVIVYVPNAPLDPFPSGAACDKCGAVASGNPIVTALTDAKGHFRLENVPVGTDIPLVMQVGKWRRKIIVPEVKECVDNPLTDKSQTRLPRSKKEGDLPKIAVATGGADELECFLREIGIEDGEFTGGGGSGSVHLYQGTLGSTMSGVTSAQPFWSSLSNLRKYDVVMLSCEGAEHAETKGAAATAAMEQYANLGGRVFASHYHYYWMKSGPAAWASLASWTALSVSDPATEYLIDTAFPKGKAFGSWLLNVGASTTLGKINLDVVRDDLTTITSKATRWVYRAGPESVKYMSFATPVGKPAEEQCGRAVFSDIHISARTAVGGGTFPSSCTPGSFSPQEKALEFLFFDLSSCVQPDGELPKPPPVK